MSDPSYREFEFYTNGLETAARAALNAQVGEYAGDVALYNGELDQEDLEQALRDLVTRCPLFLLGYVKGKNTWEHPISPVCGAPWVVRHDFLFAVILVDDNPQGDEERRRKVNVMVGDTLRALSNRQLYLAVETEGEEGPVIEQVLLNPGELKETDVELIASLQDLSARAVPFEGYFRYLTPDRRDEPIPVSGVELELESAGNYTGTPGMPGIRVE